MKTKYLFPWYTTDSNSTSVFLHMRIQFFQTNIEKKGGLLIIVLCTIINGYRYVYKGSCAYSRFHFETNNLNAELNNDECLVLYFYRKIIYEKFNG